MNTNVISDTKEAKIQLKKQLYQRQPPQIRIECREAELEAKAGNLEGGRTSTEEMGSQAGKPKIASRAVTSRLRVQDLEAKGW
jgi:hypothetical protein